MRSFCEKKKIFRNQHGFRKGHNTGSALIEYTTFVHNKRSEKHVVGTAFLDLSGAYDTVEHKILLAKLRSLGLDKNSIKWIQSYLEDRTQCVSISGKVSEKLKVNYGLPQGAILSPLLFIIYVSDIEDYMSETTDKLIGYADDFNVSVIGENSQEVRSLLVKAIQEIQSYMSRNGLMLNPIKTEVMIFDSRRNKRENVKLMLDQNTEIEESKSVRMLGVHISNDLSWSTHLNKLLQDMSSRMGIISKLRYNLTIHQCAIIAQGLVLSKLRYCLSTFGYARLSESEPKNALQEQIQVKINDMLRLMTHVSRKDKVSIEDLTKPFPWSSVNRLCIENIVCDAWKLARSDLDVADEFNKDYMLETRSSKRQLMKARRINCSNFVRQGVKIMNSEHLSLLSGASCIKDVKKIVKDKVCNFPF